MSKVWLVVIQGSQHGPLSNAELKALADRGGLKPTDHVWKEGLAEWIPASKIKGLFPPAPPPIPPPPPPDAESAPRSTAVGLSGLEPSLGEVVIPDDDASEAWKNREAPLKGNFGILGGLFKKHMQEVVINHRQRVFRYLENGRPIILAEVLDRLETNYSNRGFKIQRFATSLVVTKLGEGASTKIDTAPKPLKNVGSLINGFIRVAESGDSWAVSVKGEAFFWPQAMQQFMGAAGLACLALIIFWPCLCIIPFMFAVDGDQAKAALKEDLNAPVEKLGIEFV